MTKPAYNIYEMRPGPTIREAAAAVVDAMLKGWTLRESQLGMALWNPDSRDVYLVPADVVQYLIDADLLVFHPRGETAH